MTSTKLLCNFFTNPFGNEQKARELLSELRTGPYQTSSSKEVSFAFRSHSIFWPDSPSQRTLRIFPSRRFC